MVEEVFVNIGVGGDISYIGVGGSSRSCYWRVVVVEEREVVILELAGVRELFRYRFVNIFIFIFTLVIVFCFCL